MKKAIFSFLTLALCSIAFSSVSAEEMNVRVLPRVDKRPVDIRAEAELRARLLETKRLKHFKENPRASSSAPERVVDRPEIIVDRPDGVGRTDKAPQPPRPGKIETSTEEVRKERASTTKPKLPQKIIRFLNFLRSKEN